MKIKRLQDAYRNGVFMMKLLHRLRKMGLTLEFYYVHVGRPSDLQDVNESWEPKLAEYEAGFLHEEDMSEVASCEEWLSEELLLDRMRRGLKCFAVKHRGQIVSYLWCAFEEIACACYQTKLKENEVHLFNAYTRPDYRGKGLAPFMRYQCYNALSNMGIEKFYSVCDVFNAPSVRYKEKTNTPLHKLGLFFALGDKYSRNWILKEYETA